MNQSNSTRRFSAPVVERTELAPLMPVDAVAKRYGCSVATVWRHAAAGLLPKPVKLGGLTRWVPEEVNAAVAAAMAARGPRSAA